MLSVPMDRDFLTDLFSDFGPVTIRPMFSGFGISADGINFALSLRSGLYFRADEATIPQFEAEGSRAVSVSDQRPRPSPSTRTGNCRRGCSTTPKSLANGRGRRWRRRNARRCARVRRSARRQRRLPGRLNARSLVSRKRAASTKKAPRRANAPGEKVLTMRNGYQATWLCVSAAYSGSTSQITRLRPLRLAA